MLGRLSGVSSHQYPRSVFLCSEYDSLQPLHTIIREHLGVAFNPRRRVMLMRASNRALPQDVYRSSLACLERLQLPFLCPAFFNPSSGFRTSSSTTKIHPKHRRKPDRSLNKAFKHTVSGGLSHQRRLASAATSNYIPQQDVFVPWEGSPSPAYVPAQAFNGQNLTALRTFDPNSTPIILKDSLQSNPKIFRARYAISGNVNEIHQTLHACLQVGRLQRAAALVRRLNEIYKPDVPGLLAAHNDYIGELSHRIVQNKDQELLKNLQKWFEVDLVGAGIQPNDTIYASMVRATSQSTDGDKERTIERYLNLAREAGILGETEDLLSIYKGTESVCLQSLIFSLFPDLTDDVSEYWSIRAGRSITRAT